MINKPLCHNIKRGETEWEREREGCLQFNKPLSPISTSEKLTFIINGEGLIACQDFIFANITVFRRAISIRRFDSNDFIIQPSFIDLFNVTRLDESRRILVDVDHWDMYRCTKKKIEWNISTQNKYGPDKNKDLALRLSDNTI